MSVLRIQKRCKRNKKSHVERAQKDIPITEEGCMGSVVKF